MHNIFNTISEGSKLQKFSSLLEQLPYVFVFPECAFLLVFPEASVRGPFV
jgi:hypothetical protein